jgi:hypothetical protein
MPCQDLTQSAVVYMQLQTLARVFSRAGVGQGIVSLLIWSIEVAYACFSCSQNSAFYSPHEAWNTLSMTPSSVDSTFPSISNETSSFHMQFDGNSLLQSPFPSINPSESWDSVPSHKLERLSPLDSPFPPVDFAIHLTPDIEMILLSKVISHHNQRRQKNLHKASLLVLLQEMQWLNYTIINIFMFVIDGEDRFCGFCNALFLPKNRTSFISLLDRLFQDNKGWPIVSKWMFPHALHMVCEQIHSKMEAAKPHLCMNMGDVFSEFIEQWDIHHIMGPVASYTTPTLKTVLEATGELKVSLAKPKSAKLKNHFTALLIIMAQIHYLCSRNSARVPIGLGLHAWACGTLRQMIDALHWTCLMVSDPSIMAMVQSLADRSIERAQVASLLPHCEWKIG